MFGRIAWLMCVVGSLACSEDKTSKKHPKTDTDTDTDSGAPEADLDCPESLELGIESSTGCTTGEQVGSIEQWMGIPYAEPPIDELRFARTVPVTPWTEPFAADAAGAICPQWWVDGTTATLVGDEDCLTLNIFRPAGTESTAMLPILFYTHGGSYTSGAGSLDAYALEPQLAERAIVITHNYRLGPFGFFPHEDITEEDNDEYGDGGSSGNQGLFDSLTALQWVVDNASAMGGDPSQLLVFGESAGGTTTCAFLASPLAEGMFSAAMIQSAGCGFMEWPLRDISGTDFTFSAEDYGDYIANELDCYGGESLQCLRDIDAEDLMVSLAEYQFSVNVDNVFLTAPAREAFGGGNFNQVPIFAGFNENEGVMFSGSMGVDTEADLATFLQSYGESLQLSEPALLADIYTTSEFGSPQQAFDAFYGDAYFACPTRSFLQAVSDHVETRGYFFSEAPDWLQYWTGYEEWGAFHTAELPFVFGTQMEYYTASEQNLSAVMQQAWVSTLTSPEVDGIGGWPLFAESGGVSENGGTLVQYETGATEVTEAVFQDRCDLLDTLGWHNY